MPWAALDNSGLWELVKRGVPGTVTDAVVKRLNILGGLSQAVYWSAADNDAFAEAL